jgi:DNA polymerase III epsilon subunit-like protein
MRWFAADDLRFADTTIPAGAVVQEIWEKQLRRPADLKAWEVEKTNHRRQKRLRPIMARYAGKLRFLDPLDLVPETVLVIDTETTGMSKPKDGHPGAQVVEIGLAVVRRNVLVERKSCLVRCAPEHLDGPAWYAAVRTHGITRKAVLEAPEKERVGRRLAAWYKRLGSPACAAYPTSFDSRIIQQTWPTLRLFWHPALCIQAQWRAVMKKKHPKLTVAAEFLQVTPPKGRAHRAEYDAVLAAQVMLALRKHKGRQKPPRLPLSEKAEAAEQRIQAALGVG